MQTFNLTEVKTNFADLVNQVVDGHPFVIAKSGQTVAKVVPYKTPARSARLGFMENEAVVEIDIKEVGRKEIAEMFEITS